MAQNSNHQQISCVNTSDDFVVNASNSNEFSLFKRISKPNILASKNAISQISQEDGSMDSSVKITSAQRDGALQLEESAFKEKTAVYAGIPIIPKPSGSPSLCNEMNTQRKFQIMTYSERNLYWTTPPQPIGWSVENPPEKKKCQITPQTTRFAMENPPHKNINRTLVAISENKFYPCRLCGNIFMETFNRARHEKEMHKFHHKQILKCAKCSKPFHSYRELIVHLQKVHTHIDFKTETLFFVGPEDFQNWKVAIEKETVSEYVLDDCVERKNYIKQTFICRPNGQFKTYAEKGLEIWESNNTGSFCPARMYVLTRVTNDFYVNVEVSHLKTHVGHECGVQSNSLESNQTSETNQARVYGRVITSIHDYYKLHQKNGNGFDAENKELKCSVCLSVFPLKTEIIKHITKMHSAICMEETSIYFRKFEEFVEWKMDVEKYTGIEYVVYRPHEINSKWLLLDCHLSGKGEPGFFCPAGITLKVGSSFPGTYMKVEYMFTHLGHETKQVMKRIDKIGKFELCRTTVLYHHIAAKNISREVSITKRNEGEWVVSPCLDDSRAHVVKKVDFDSQHNCNAVKCFQCNICFHQFKCTCYSKTNHKKICEHIHISCMMNKRRENIENINLIPNRTGKDPFVNIDSIDGDSVARGQEKLPKLHSQDIAENQRSLNAKEVVSAYYNI